MDHELYKNGDSGFLRIMYHVNGFITYFGIERAVRVMNKAQYVVAGTVVRAAGTADNTCFGGGYDGRYARDWLRAYRHLSK